MELNVLRTEEGYIDLPKEIIYRSGDHIIIKMYIYFVFRLCFYIFAS